MGELAQATVHSPSRDRTTADHRWPSAHYPARYTARANPPRHLPGVACTRTHRLPNQTLDAKYSLNAPANPHEIKIRSEKQRIWASHFLANLFEAWRCELNKLR